MQVLFLQNALQKLAYHWSVVPRIFFVAFLKESKPLILSPYDDANFSQKYHNFSPSFYIVCLSVLRDSQQFLFCNMDSLHISGSQDHQSDHKLSTPDQLIISWTSPSDEGSRPKLSPVPFFQKYCLTRSVTTAFCVYLSPFNIFLVFFLISLRSRIRPFGEYRPSADKH